MPRLTLRSERRDRKATRSEQQPFCKCERTECKNCICVLNGRYCWSKCHKGKHERCINMASLDDTQRGSDIVDTQEEDFFSTAAESLAAYNCHRDDYVTFEKSKDSSCAALTYIVDSPCLVHDIGALSVNAAVLDEPGSCSNTAVVVKAGTSHLATLMTAYGEVSFIDDSIKEATFTKEKLRDFNERNNHLADFQPGTLFDWPAWRRRKMDTMYLLLPFHKLVCYRDNFVRKFEAIVAKIKMCKKDDVLMDKLKKVQLCIIECFMKCEVKELEAFRQIIEKLKLSRKRDENITEVINDIQKLNEMIFYVCNEVKSLRPLIEYISTAKFKDLPDAPFPKKNSDEIYFEETVQLAISIDILRETTIYNCITNYCQKIEQVCSMFSFLEKRKSNLNDIFNNIDSDTYFIKTQRQEFSNFLKEFPLDSRFLQEFNCTLDVQKPLNFIQEMHQLRNIYSKVLKNIDEVHFSQKVQLMFEKALPKLDIFMDPKFRAAKKSHDYIKLPKLEIGDLVDHKWLINSQLGMGGFGRVLFVKNINTHELAAMKTEDKSRTYLNNEKEVLTELLGHSKFPQFIDYGSTSKVNFVVTSLLGKNLHDLWVLSRKSFNISTQIRIGVHALFAIKKLHDIGYVHRDIKPPNFAIGTRGRASRIIHLLDFGLAQKFTKKCGKIRLPLAFTGRCGTMDFMSVAAMAGKEQTRADDLISLLYMLASFRESLPWAKKNSDSMEEFKETIKDTDLFKMSSPQLIEIMKYLRPLDFFHRPNYEYVYSKFKEILDEHCVRDSDPYDWETCFEYDPWCILQSGYDRVADNLPLINVEEFEVN